MIEQASLITRHSASFTQDKDFRTLQEWACMMHLAFFLLLILTQLCFTNAPHRYPLNLSSLSFAPTFGSPAKSLAGTLSRAVNGLDGMKGT